MPPWTAAAAYRLRQVRYATRLLWSHPSNQGRRLRQLTTAGRVELAQQLLGRPSVVRLGQHARVWTDGWGTKAAAYANPPDHVEMTHWRAVLRPGDLFVDVGANAGLYTVWAGDCGARVVAVEPDPDALRRLRRNVALGGYPVEVHACALAARAGRGWLSTGWDLRNRLVDDGQPVPLRTLDEVLGDRHAAGVKLDTEGAERLVLEGATRALAERRVDRWQVEWNSCSQALLGEDRGPVRALLEAAGYRLYRPGGAPVRDDDGGADVFAVRRDLDPEQGRSEAP